MDLGDSTGLPIYLESSPASQGLYRKLGFLHVPQNLASVVHDKDVLGAEEDVEVPLMIKLPRAETGSGTEAKGDDVESLYREWNRRKDSGYWETDGMEQVETKA